MVEYCPNGSLKNYLQHQQSHPLPLEEALDSITKIGKALHYSHQHNIVHCDLKPANILFNVKGEVVLTDFAIAKLLESTTFTNPGGTPAYMAPEQFHGTVSKKSDQFALGCIAYELVAGQRPFLHSRTLPLIPPSTLNPLVPSHIDQAILKALSERHTDRHKDIITFIDALEKTAQQWLDKGRTSYRLQKYDEALVAFEQAIHLDPNLALAYLGKGYVFNDLKWNEAANYAFEQAIHLDPNLALAYNSKGNALLALNRHEEALAAFEQVIRLDPNYTLAYLGKGNALYALQRNAEALFAFDQAIHLDPNLALAYRGKGKILIELKRHEEALIAFEQAIRLNPNYAAAYYDKGVALDNLGKSREAKQAYDKARQLGYTG